MIEKIILDYLSGLLPVPVAVERAIDPPAQYVLLEQTAGSETNYISQATVAIQTYADTRYEAASLMEAVIEAMHGIIELDAVSAVRLTGSYNYTDVTEKKYRYQAVYNVTYYREG